MKKLLVLSLLVFCFSFLSCASDPAKDASSMNSAKNSALEDKDNNNQSTAVKTGLKRYEVLDWQYKGFGEELPAWVAALYEGGAAEAKKLFPEYDPESLMIFFTYAGRLDLSEALFNSLLKKEPEEVYEIDRPELFDEDGMRIFKVGDEFRLKGLGTTLNLNGDIYQVKDRTWVLLKEIFYDAEGNYEKEEISYRSLAILVREDTGL